MPRSLCAAKRQIKETVISSTESAADSYVFVAERASGAGEGGGVTLQQSVEGENHGGRDEGETGRQTVGQRLDTRFTAVTSPLERNMGGWGDEGSGGE